MAKTTIQGLLGGVTIAGYTIKFSNWTATINISTADTTGFEDKGYRVREPMLARMSGTASGTAITDSPPIIATLFGANSTMVPATLTVANLVLTAQTGCTYTLTKAIITSVSISRPQDGKCDVVISFANDGAWVEVWDEA